MRRGLIILAILGVLMVPSVVKLTCYHAEMPSPSVLNTASDLYAFQLNCTVRVLAGPAGWGSGVWVAPHIILTAKHVVDGCDSVEIELYSGRKITASQFVLDRDDDLALILVNNFTSEHYATLGAKPLVGQEVTLVGSPVDEICKFNLTKGHVSALIAKVPDEYDPDKYGVPHFIVDCFGAAGNSGGPVFRGKEIIGLCIWGLDRSGASMSLIADTTHLDAALKACF